MLRAFLLTRQWRDKPTGIELELWFSSEQGPVCVLIDEQQAVFFVHQQDVPRLEKLFAPDVRPFIKNLGLKSFANKPVAGLYFNSQYALYRARDTLKQHRLQYFEADIRALERYLNERFLTGPVILQLTKKSHDCSAADKSLQRWTNPLIKPADYQPVFKVISLDIETAFDSQTLYSISLLDKQHKITLMLDESTELQDVYTESHLSLIHI